jgi:capsid assembly protease
VNALDVVQRQPWAIRPEALQMILEIAAREHIPDMVAAAERLEARRRNIETDAVATKPGTRLEGAPTVVMRGSTAVLPIEGPITRYANLFSDISGGTSIEILARDFQTALASDAVQSIVLHVDSPGGQSSGVGELADILYAARGAKPIWAYVSHMGASAAYWLASATDRIVVAPSSMVGSIGVIASVPDPKRQPGDDFEFVSSQSPNKKPDPATKEGRGQIQTLVDDLADVFVASVARNRGVTVQTVLDDFGAGDVLVGDKAVQAGLADAIGSFEQVLIDIQNPVPEPAAVEAAPPEPPRPPANPARRTGAMNIREAWSAFVAGVPAGTFEDAEQTVAAPPVPPPVTAARVQPDPELVAARQQREELERRLAASEAENRRIRAERIAERAQAFAEQQITAGRAFPAEEAQIVALFTQAATDDAELGVIRQENGITTSRVAHVTAAYTARQSHNLTREQLTAATTAQALQVLANIESTTSPKDGPMTKERRAELLGYTEVGRAVLASEKAQANGRGN